LISNSLIRSPGKKLAGGREDSPAITIHLEDPTMKESVLDRLLRYVKVDTQSQEDSESYPSTSKQFDLLNMLVLELKALGLKDVGIDKYGYVMATLPGNVPASHPAHGKVPTVGFVAHVDTSPSTSGTNVKPQVITRYAGGDIVLPGDPSVVIRDAENPQLKKEIGRTIVTSDGTTLLGADDKAGTRMAFLNCQSLGLKSAKATAAKSKNPETPTMANVFLDIGSIL